MAVFARSASVSLSSPRPPQRDRYPSTWSGKTCLSSGTPSRPMWRITFRVGKGGTNSPIFEESGPEGLGYGGSSIYSTNPGSKPVGSNAGASVESTSPSRSESDIPHGLDHHLPQTSLLSEEEERITPPLKRLM